MTTTRPASASAPGFRPGDRVRCNPDADGRGGEPATVRSVYAKHLESVGTVVVRVTFDDGFGGAFAVGGLLDHGGIILDDSLGPVPDHVLEAYGWDRATTEAMRLNPSHPGCTPVE